MTRGKGYVLGSEPPEDPMAEVTRSSFSVTSSTKIRWDDREVKDSLTVSLALVVFCFFAVLFVPILSIVVISIASVVLYWLPSFVISREQTNSQSAWTDRENKIPKLIEDEKFLRAMSEEKFSITALELVSAPTKLPGNLASLIRALPSSDGFTLTITMQPGDPERVIEDNNVTGSIEKYLRTRSKGEIESYMDYHGSLWIAKAQYIGLVRDHADLRFHESAVRGSLPTKGWKRSKTSETLKRITEYRGGFSHPAYYAVGEELSDWLVQLRSELSSEVGTNVPGQFVVDIRSRPADLPLGVILNPDTLQTGTQTGLSFTDIANGVLLSGGDRQSRLSLMALVVEALVNHGKRVMIVSNKPDALVLASLHESGIGLTLGKGMVVNPVDAESVPRNVYVTKFLRALETLADKNLTSATDLEVAIGRAVAIPNSTVADIRFETDTEGMSDDEILKTNIHPVKLSLWGLEAVRKLHEGSGARAFYGTQTASMASISKYPLSVIVSGQGDLPLDIFAVDLILIKLGGLEEDKDLVVILDDIDGFRIANNRYSNRALWTDTLVRELSKKTSVIVSMDQPHMLSSGIMNELSSCISLRLRDEKDIASISSRLALSVIGAGLHSKARWSARESSFLRTMEDGLALLVHNAVETAQPIRLSSPPELAPLTSEELAQRAKSILHSAVLKITSGSGGIISPTSMSEDTLVIKILRLIQRYEPLTEEAIRRFIQTSGEDGDVEGILIQLKEASLILEGHESHSGVSYKNYRLTMKGSMALRQADKEVAVE